MRHSRDLDGPKRHLSRLTGVREGRQQQQQVAYVLTSRDERLRSTYPEVQQSELMFRLLVAIPTDLSLPPPTAATATLDTNLDIILNFPA